MLSECSLESTTEFTNELSLIYERSQFTLRMQSLLMIHAYRFAGTLSSNYGIWAAYQNMKREERDVDREKKDPEIQRSTQVDQQKHNTELCMMRCDVPKRTNHFH